MYVVITCTYMHDGNLAHFDVKTKHFVATPLQPSEWFWVRSPWRNEEWKWYMMEILKLLILQHKLCPGVSRGRGAMGAKAPLPWATFIFYFFFICRKRDKGALKIKGTKFEEFFEIQAKIFGGAPIRNSPLLAISWIRPCPSQAWVPKFDFMPYVHCAWLHALTINIAF